MNAVLLWKEYRQQRGLWLAMFLLAVISVIGLSAVLGNPSTSIWHAFGDKQLSTDLNTTLACLVVTYGIVLGAMLIASEKEDGTLWFLDSLAGRRGPVWIQKLLIGVILTSLLSLALAVLSIALGSDSWENIPYLLGLGLNALGCGLLAGSFCRTVLIAVLTGIVFMSLNWVIAGSGLIAFVETTLSICLLEAALSFIVFYVSWQIFCKDDFARGIGRRSKKSSNSTQVVLRFAIRQSRWTFAAVLVGALLIGCFTSEDPLVIWPVGTLLLGLACGLTVFVPDQNGGKQFLASQRFPLIEYWSPKTLCSLMVLIFATGLAILSALLTDDVGQVSYGSDEPTSWVELWTGSRYTQNSIEPILLIVLWPLYGFFFGQFFGLLASRPIIAAFLSTVFAIPFAAVFGLSLVVGGVPLWWICIIPATLLSASRLLMRPWAAGQLSTRRPAMGIASAAALLAITLGVFCWRRATEVPILNGPEPLDEKAIISSLPTREKNEAGFLLRRARDKMIEHRTKVENHLGRPDNLKFWVERHTSDHEIFDYLLRLVIIGGWPSKDKDIGSWLDELFKGDWAIEVRKAAKMPLGMVMDPRLASLYEFSTIQKMSEDYECMAFLFIARALQVQASGSSVVASAREALDDLDVALALARQVKNYSPEILFRRGCEIEAYVLRAYIRWLEKVGPEKELLRTPLAMLQRHEAADPDLISCIKTQYIMPPDSNYSYKQQLADSKYRYNNSQQRQAEIRFRNRDTLRRLIDQIPWEHERQERIYHDQIISRYRVLTGPDPKRMNYHNRDAWVALEAGLPPDSGPGSELDAEQWGELLCQLPYTFDYSQQRYLQGAIGKSERLLRATQIVTALALYQVDHGSAPSTLDDLVPDYLAKIPLDPIGKTPFGYRVFNEGDIDWPFPEDRNKMLPGQALLWASEDQVKSEIRIPVPMWKK